MCEYHKYSLVVLFNLVEELTTIFSRTSSTLSKEVFNIFCSLPKVKFDKVKFANYANYG
jgi:hypothetical protein